MIGMLVISHARCDNKSHMRFTQFIVLSARSMSTYFVRRTCNVPKNRFFTRKGALSQCWQRPIEGPCHAPPQHLWFNCYLDLARREHGPYSTINVTAGRMSSKSHWLVVIDGGVAGLQTTRALFRAGFTRVTVLEESDDVGSGTSFKGINHEGQMFPRHTALVQQKCRRPGVKAKWPPWPTTCLHPSYCHACTECSAVECSTNAGTPRQQV
eukprot:1033414-Pelagomonas_calceolata.AAC.5